MSKCESGRIVYFEPNELFGGNNIPVNQEELTKYVNISVRIPSRFYDSNARKRYDSILQGSRFEETISGDTYTKFYLTDNYVNVSYNEIRNNGNVLAGELFGIDSIDISFDVQFFPQVTINFTDVRGFGLMSTMEHAYSYGNVQNMTAKSFFTSLFNFPYPIFTLEVKGYYGKNVSFDLSLLDFNTAFDSQTGNFKTRVSFIGHMWGVLGDIPMSYLMISPYIDYDGSEITNGDDAYGQIWSRMGNTDIPTYLSILNKYNNLLNNTSNSNNSDFNIVNKYVQNANRIEILSGLRDLYHTISATCTDNISSYESHEIYGEVNKDDNNDKLYFIYESDSTGNSFETIINNLNNFVIDKGLSDNYKIVEKNNNNGNKIIYQTSGISSFNIYIIENLLETINGVNTEIENLTTTNNASIDNVNDNIVRIVKETMGFKPTIENVYKIIFKHLDCFSTHFYNTVKNINPNNRLKNIIGNDYFTDIPTTENRIPPFPLIGKNQTREIVYPGTISGFSEQPEVKLTDSIYNSITNFTNKMLDAVSDIESSREENISPVSIYRDVLLFDDFRTDIDDNEKHYNVIKNQNYRNLYNDKSSIAEGIRDIFLSRLATYGKIHYLSGETNYNKDRICEIESKFISHAIPSLDGEIKRHLRGYSKKDIEDRFRNLSGGDDYGYVNYVKYCEYNNNEYLKSLGRIHSNDDLKSSIVILKIGDKTSCENYYNSLLCNNFKTDFNERTPREWSSVTANNRYYFTMEDDEIKDNKVESGSSEKKLVRGEKLIKEREFDWNSGDGDKWPSYENRVFIGRTYIGHEDVCNFAFDSYTKYLYNPRVEYDGIFGRMYNESTKENKKNDLNKIVILQFSELLAIGECFHCKKILIPLTAKDEGYGINSDEFNNTFSELAGNVNGNYTFADFCINLYKKYILGSNIADSSILSINNKIKYNNEIQHYDEYYIVFAKNFEYPGKANLNINEVYGIWKHLLSKLFPTDEIISSVSREETREKEILDIKTNIYYTLKNLYDNWLSGLNEEYFSLSNQNSEYSKVSYLTTTFEDISNTLVVNIENLTNQIISITNNADNSMHSVISFMAKTAQDNHCTFLSLPININHDNIEDIFKPYNFYDNSTTHDEQGTTYLVLHHGNLSHNLDIEGSDYSNDGYDIANYINEGVEISSEAAQIYVEEGHSKKIESFGVTYGMQNQNFFRNITIDTTNPSTTDYSIMNTLAIAEQGSQMSVNTQSINKQSLYPIYANRSYTCSVDMMGCMEITPLMYFQLNNVPMFRGAYLITNVNHKITPNDFVTTFTGVRVSKYKIPLNKEVINIGSIARYFGNVNNSAYTEYTDYIDKCFDVRNNDVINSESSLPDIGDINKITIHISAGENGDNELTVCDIHNFHLKNGWAGIGYHFYIDKDGKIYPGRPITKRGAHVQGYNEGNIGICFDGPNDKDYCLQNNYPNDNQRKSLANLVYVLKTYYNVNNDYIKGHNFYNNNKTCPNFDVDAAMEENGFFNTLLESSLSVDTAVYSSNYLLTDYGYSDEPNNFTDFYDLGYGVNFYSGNYGEQYYKSIWYLSDKFTPKYFLWNIQS